MHNYEIFQYLSSESIEPREFLRYCFGINRLTPEAIIYEEIRFGYSTRCINLISKFRRYAKKDGARVG